MQRVINHCKNMQPSFAKHSNIPRRKNVEFFHFSEVTAQTIVILKILSFWLPCTESSPMVDKMRGMATIIISSKKCIMENSYRL